MKAKLTVIPIFSLLLFGCGLFAPRPDVVWQPDADAVVLELSNCCGYVPYETVINALPDAIIYGDGRYIWVQNNADNQRVVTEGQLSEAEMRDLLQEFVDAGFYGWKDQYANYNVTDLPNQCIRLRLEGNSKSVCEYYEGAPRAFHMLYDRLSAGAGMSGTPYVPERAFVTSLAFDYEVPPEDAIAWSVDELGFSLADAGGGVWLEGDALVKAWEIVNASSWSGATADEGRDNYHLLVQVPGLSLSDPPIE